MSDEISIRNEPGEYRITARYGDDGSFAVAGESVRPITLTVRVEDVWNRLPQEVRRHSYGVEVRRDGEDRPSAVLEDVAPDARIFLDFRKTFDMRFA